MDVYKQNLYKEVAGFREIGHRFLRKELTVAEFKAASGGMGVYAQRGGEKFMIRLRIPSGIFDYNHFKLIGNYISKYNLEYVHFTTRQALQLHDLDIDTLCDIMEDAIINGLYSRGSGGNFPRNVSLSPLAGVDKEEAFDVTPYAKAAGAYLMDKITKYRLPRKLKIAFSSSGKDTANATLADLGFIAQKQGNKQFFKVYVGGGLGNNARLAVEIDELIRPSEVLDYVEAVLRIFMAEGDYENKNRARLRYVCDRMGEDAFINCFKGHVKEVKETMNLKKVKGVRSIITNREVLTENNMVLREKEVILQKQPGLYTVEIHPPCGIISGKEFLMLMDCLENQEYKDVRLSMTESIYIRNLKESGVLGVLKIYEKIKRKENIYKSVTCIGVPTCQIGILNSRELLHSTIIYLEEKKIPLQYLPSIYVSGCFNSCGRHQVSPLGFAGGKKRVEGQIEEVFEIHVGGKVLEGGTRFGKVLGQIKSSEVPVFMNELGCRLYELKKEYSEYIEEDIKDFEHLVSTYLV
ncbi:MAG: nitrite/sulfite reductase [Anaerocolumna sp.]